MRGGGPVVGGKSTVRRRGYKWEDILAEREREFIDAHL